MKFEDSKGKAAFISHQWVGGDHPDPEFRQFSILQAALRPQSGKSGLGFKVCKDLGRLVADAANAKSGPIYVLLQFPDIFWIGSFTNEPVSAST